MTERTATAWLQTFSLAALLIAGCTAEDADGEEGEGEEHVDNDNEAAGPGGKAAIPAAPVATYTVPQFGRSDTNDELFFLADVEIRVRSTPDDGSVCVARS